MPESTINLRTAVPTFAVATAKAMPLQFQKAVTDVPDGIKVSTKVPAVQLTSNSLRKQYKRNAVILSHWVNLPFEDGLMSVAKIYKPLELLAFNYDRTHQDSFFESWPDAILLAEGQDPSELTTSWLRRNYRTLCKRVAHYAYHYLEAKKVQCGALANLMLLTKLNGNEFTKRIAYDVRWSKINTHCNLYERFPQPKGMEAYLAPLARYATGKSSYGADLVSFPLFRTEIWGNVENHSIPIDSNVKTILPINSGVVFATTDDQMSNPEYCDEAITTLSAIAAQWGYGQSRNADPLTRNPIGSIPLAMPHIENGSAITIDRSAAFVTNQRATVTLNRDGVEFADAMKGNGAEDNLTGRLWRNYDYITDYLVQCFPEMMDPNSDLYILMTKELGLAEQSSKLEDLIKLYRDQPECDIYDLAKFMVYKQDGRATTATIIKWAPLLYSTDGSDKFRGSTFSQNFERYDVDENNTALMLAKSKVWPKIAPTMFMDGAQSPIAVNACQTVGREFDSASEAAAFQRASLSITGKFASYFDFTVNNALSPEHARIEGIGIEDSFLEQFVSKSGDALVFEECPDFITVPIQPPFDCTDLGQCGFNLVISAGDPNPNEWDMHFTRENNYFKQNSDVLAGSVYATTIGGQGPYPIADVDDGSVYEEGLASDRRHVVNQNHLAALKTALVFVGGSIFQAPLQAFANIDCGYFKYALHIQHGAEAFQNLRVGMLTALTPSSEDTTLERAFGGMIAAASKANAVTAPDELGSYGMFAQIALRTIQNDVIIDQWVFNPLYGPVFPLMVQKPFGNVIPAIPVIGDQLTGSQVSMYQPSEQSTEPKVMLFDNCYYGQGMHGNNVKSMQAALTPRLAYDITLTPGEDLIFFISLIQFATFSINYRTGAITSGEVVSLDLLTISKWVYASVAAQIAQFMGLADTQPFWSAKLSGRPEISVASGGGIPENNIIAVRRTNRVSRGPDVSIGSMVSGEKFSSTSEYGSQRESSDKSSTKRRRRHSRRKFSAKASKSQEKQPEVNSDGVIDSSAPTNLLGKEGGSFDYSSKSEDDKAEKVKKSKINAVELMQ